MQISYQNDSLSMLFSLLFFEYGKVVIDSFQTRFAREKGSILYPVASLS